MPGWPHYCYAMGQLLPALCLMAFLIDYFPCVRLCFNIINCFYCDFWFVIESKTLCDITHLFPSPSLSENYSQADKVRTPCHCGEAYKGGEEEMKISENNCELSSCSLPLLTWGRGGEGDTEPSLVIDTLTLRIPLALRQAGDQVKHSGLKHKIIEKPESKS